MNYVQRYKAALKLVEDLNSGRQSSGYLQPIGFLFNVKRCKHAENDDPDCKKCTGFMAENDSGSNRCLNPSFFKEISRKKE